VKRNLVTIDFETERIQPRPDYPPEPVGVAIHAYGMEPRYLAWGHPAGNNCGRGDAVELLRQVHADESAEVLYHNAAFDLSVSVERLGLPMLPWHRVHDTMFLLFLHDPHAPDLRLKSSAERILGWAPEERDEVHDWIYAHRHELTAQYGGKITRAKSGENSPGAWIAKAPGGLVGRYAVGDVLRTRALFDHLHPLIASQGMEAAYDRERRLLPVLMENERIGLRVDLEALERDVPLYRRALEKVEMAMRIYLGVDWLNFDADKDVAAVFQERGVVHPDAWKTTEKSGDLSVSKDNLPPEAFVDPLLASAFGYRNRLVTCLKMFMQPWAAQAAMNRGYINPRWNQVRGSRGGTRSGRPSMTEPNLLNVSKSWDDRSDGYVHPAALGLPRLPEVRRYVLPDEGHVFLHRDFKGQEVRIFAHYESGELANAYRADPLLDPHDWVKEAIRKAVGRELERTRVKNVTFARLYGGGEGAVMWQARCSSRAEAKELIAFHDAAIPGRRILSEEILRKVRRGEPIRTWGGRLYHVEPPSFSKKYNRHMTYEYKLINYLVQGSAADATKEALCRWYHGWRTEPGNYPWRGNTTGARFLLTVYDEINISAPIGCAAQDMTFLRKMMDGIELDVPLLSDGKRGTSWGTLEKCE
jgi:DNA polymerase I-like protein with 3'-5' exonuclease and polymerase domains